MEHIKNYVIIPHKKNSYFVVFTPTSEFQREINAIKVTPSQNENNVEELIKNKLSKIFKVRISEFYSIGTNKNFVSTYIKIVDRIDITAISFYGIEYYTRKMKLYKILSIICFTIGASSSIIFSLFKLPKEYVLYPGVIFGLLVFIYVSKFIYFRDRLPITLKAITNAERQMGRSIDDYPAEGKMVLLNKFYGKDEITQYLNK